MRGHIACLQTPLRRRLTFCRGGTTRWREPRTVHHSCLDSWGRRRGASGEGREGIIITITLKREKNTEEQQAPQKKPVLGREIQNSHNNAGSCSLYDLHYNAAAVACLLQQCARETCKMGGRQRCTFCVCFPFLTAVLSVSNNLNLNPTPKPKHGHPHHAGWRGGSRAASAFLRGQAVYAAYPWEGSSLVLDAWLWHPRGRPGNAQGRRG